MNEVIAVTNETSTDANETEALDIIPRGKASQVTRGGIILIFNEPGTAPFNWYLLPP